MRSGVQFSFFFIVLIVTSISAPGQSSLLMNPNQGKFNLFAYSHTVSVYASTPIIASNIPIAPSATQIDHSTSPVKSEWPGVSIKLI